MAACNSRSAFTLIELLVVVTIIVVLLALLVPAMDKAIYQAELAVCGTNLHAIGRSASTYAFDNKRRYPHRPGQETHTWKPSNIYLGSFLDRPESPSRGPDDRPYLKNYFSINNLFNDPLADKMDFENAMPNSNVEVSYQLWFGFRYESGTPLPGMLRVGDRVTWNGDRYDLLAGDWDALDKQLPGAYGGHPDKAGAMSLLSMQDEAASPVLQLTLSRWQMSTAYNRGAVDSNYVHEDGSVSRYTDIEITGTGANERVLSSNGVEMKPVPLWDDNMEPQVQLYVPSKR